MIAVEYESNVFIKWTAITTLQPNRKGSAKALRERGFFQINNRYTHFFYRLSLNQRWALFNLPSAWCLRRFRRPAGWDAFFFFFLRCCADSGSFSLHFSQNCIPGVRKPAGSEDAQKILGSPPHIFSIYITAKPNENYFSCILTGFDRTPVNN